MDADALIRTLEGALRAGKLSPEQKENAEELLQTLRDSTPEQKKQVAASLPRGLMCKIALGETPEGSDA